MRICLNSSVNTEGRPPTAGWAIKQKHMSETQKDKALSKLLLSTSEDSPEFIIAMCPVVHLSSEL